VGAKVVFGTNRFFLLYHSLVKGLDLNAFYSFIDSKTDIDQNAL